MPTRHIVTCGLSGCIYYLRNDTIKKKKAVTEHKMCFDFLYKFYLKLFSF